VAEFGLVHRYELSGVLHGLFRVRGFVQDDAHVYCTPEQIEDEVIDCVDMLEVVYRVLGFETGWRYGLSVALAFLLGTAVSFILNRRYTFDSSRRRIPAQIRTFLFVSLGGLLLTVVLSGLFRAAILPRLLPVPAGIDLELSAHLAAVALVALYSFTAHKLFSFGRGIRFFLRPRRNGLGV